MTGKGLSGGLYPMAATLMTPGLHAFFDTRPFVHVSTFGGAELGCVVAQAVLDVTEAPGFLDRVSEVSDRLAAAFDGLPFDLRRPGLMMGFRFERADGGMAAARAAYAQGPPGVQSPLEPARLFMSSNQPPTRLTQATSLPSAPANMTKRRPSDDAS